MVLDMMTITLAILAPACAAVTALKPYISKKYPFGVNPRAATQGRPYRPVSTVGATAPGRPCRDCGKSPFVPPTVASTPLSHRDRCLSGVEGNICAKISFVSYPTKRALHATPLQRYHGKFPLTISPKIGTIK